jgi:hypothetical protein
MSDPTESKDYTPKGERLGKVTKRRPKGRPRKIDPQIVVGSADTFRAWFRQFWPKIGSRLLAAKSSEDIEHAIAQDAPTVKGGLAQHAALILEVVHDPRFPHVREAAQMEFLADSLGGQGYVTPRRSREICAEERIRVRHCIVRREFYIECSCGYKGPALDGACRDCGTGELSWELKVQDIEDH